MTYSVRPIKNKGKKKGIVEQNRLNYSFMIYFFFEGNKENDSFDSVKLTVSVLLPVARVAREFRGFASALMIRNLHHNRQATGPFLSTPDENHGQITKRRPEKNKKKKNRQLGCQSSEEF